MARIASLERMVLAGGVVLLAIGAACGLMGLHETGVAVRWAGVGAVIVFAVRRPSLMVWTFVAMVTGVELGVDAPAVAAQVKLPGDLFLRLIKMIVAPLLFASMTTGIA